MIKLWFEGSRIGCDGNRVVTGFTSSIATARYLGYRAFLLGLGNA